MDNKFKSRYGEFPVFHPLVIFFAVFCLFLTVGMFFYKDCIYMFFVNLYMVWRLISPYLEKFYLDGKRIVYKKCGKRGMIDVPPSAIFVVSYTAFKCSVSGRKKYTVNIIDENVQTILEKLHENDKACEMVAYRHKIKNALIYDNRYIESIFKSKVVYSFVYDKEIQYIFAELKRTVIVPQSLKSQINIISDGFELIVDKER